MADRNYKKWRGNPWERQSWRIKETPRKYEAFVLFYRGKSLGEIAQEMGDEITVAKINIDENPSVPGKYGVRGIPTLMIFQDGQVTATKVGAVPKGQIVDWIKSSI